MKTINWRGYNWYAYEHCKNDTPNCKNAYLGENFVPVKIGNSDVIAFRISDNPKTFNNDKLNTQRRFECAFMESEQTFSYGEFIFKIYCGNSPNTWPAVWLYGSECWPPEIDVLEAFPNAIGQVIHKRKIKWETNIHYDEHFPKQFGAKGIPYLLYKLTHEDYSPDTFILKWTPKYIKIYFNGFRIRKITNKEVLACFNRNPKMRVCINNMIQEDFSKTDCNNQKLFVIWDFKYKKYGNKCINNQPRSSHN